MKNIPKVIKYFLNEKLKNSVLKPKGSFSINLLRINVPINGPGIKNIAIMNVPSLELTSIDRKYITKAVIQLKPKLNKLQSNILWALV